MRYKIGSADVEPNCGNCWDFLMLRKADITTGADVFNTHMAKFFCAQERPHTVAQLLQVMA